MVSFKNILVILAIVLPTTGWAFEEPEMKNAVPFNLSFVHPGLAKPEWPWGWYLQPLEGAGVTVRLAEQGTAKHLFLDRKEAGREAEGIYFMIRNFQKGQEIGIESPVTLPEGTKAEIRLGLMVGKPFNPVLTKWSPRCSAAEEEKNSRVCSAEIRIPENGLSVEVHVAYGGSGPAEIGPIRLTIDGTPYLSSYLPPGNVPKAGDIAWVRGHAIALNSTDPASPIKDFQGLEPLVGDASIVMLGEATHGTHEFFTLKHRFLEWLATQRGFTVFAIEDQLAPSQAIDTYIQTGKGDPGKLVDGLFGVWSRQEVVDLAVWMRKAVVETGKSLHFTGFDLQLPLGAIQVLESFADAHDPLLVQQLKALSPQKSAWQAQRYPARGIDEYKKWQRGAQKVLEFIDAQRERYTQMTDAATFAMLRYNARVVQQSAALSTTQDPQLRDRFMAENLSRLRETYPPGTKIVVWAHNWHIRLVDGAMGDHLKQRFGDDVLSIGLTTYEGEYAAYDGKRMKPFPLLPGPPDSSEYLFHLSGAPLFALDLRPTRNLTDLTWFREMHHHRNIGFPPADFGFYAVPLSENYDVMVFVDQSTASRPIPP